jgi:tetratricopeptide (TPR) repeat protein
MWHSLSRFIGKLKSRRNDVLVHRANRQLHAGAYENAMREYDTLLDGAPDHAEALFGRAVASQALRLPYAALADFDSLLHLKPDHLDALVARGTIEVCFSRYLQALGYLDAALCIAPRHPVALANRAIARLNVRRYTETIVDCNEAILLHPRLDDTLPKEVDPTARISTEICQPPLYELFFTRGSAYLALYRNEYAIADFTQALALNRDHEQSYRQRGFAYHFQGKHTLGEQDHETARQLKEYAEAEVDAADQ